MEAIKAYLVAHFLGLLGGSAGSLVLGYLGSQLPKLIGAYVTNELAAVAGKLTTPAQKAWGKATLALIDESFPNVGDAKYSMAVDWIIAKVPALAPERPQLLTLIGAVVAALKTDLEAPGA